MPALVFKADSREDSRRCRNDNWWPLMFLLSVHLASACPLWTATELAAARKANGVNQGASRN